MNLIMTRLTVTHAQLSAVGNGHCQILAKSRVNSSKQAALLEKSCCELLDVRGLTDQQPPAVRSKTYLEGARVGSDERGVPDGKKVETRERY